MKGLMIISTMLFFFSTQAISQFCQGGAARSNAALKTGAEGIEGAWIVSIHDGSPAAMIGLQSGDLITGVDGVPICNGAEFNQLIRQKEAGNRVRIQCLRDGQFLEVDLSLVPKSRFCESTCAAQGGQAALGIRVSNGGAGSCRPSSSCGSSHSKVAQGSSSGRRFEF